jgi:DICT domain-containing protein
MKCIWCKREVIEGQKYGECVLCRECAEQPIWKAFHKAKQANDRRAFYGRWRRVEI